MINKIIGRTPNPVNKILGIGRRKTVRRRVKQEYGNWVEDTPSVANLGTWPGEPASDGYINKKTKQSMNLHDKKKETPFYVIEILGSDAEGVPALYIENIPNKKTAYKIMDNIKRKYNDIAYPFNKDDYIQMDYNNF